MKAHMPFSSKQREAMLAVIKESVENELDDIAIRCYLLMAWAMMKQGLKPSTINKTIKKYEDEVIGMYARYRADKTGDWYVYNELREYGVNVSMTKEEL